MSVDSVLTRPVPDARVRPRLAVLGLASAPLTLVVLAAVIAILPAWNPVWYQDDQLPTLFRTLHTDLAHHWGVLYPRLAPELGFGYGRLLHQFYPPLGVELAAWLHALGLGYIDAARATFSLCLLSSALGMYAYARRVLDSPWLASVAAVAYVWSPYVLLDAHKGGVLGESIALAIMPWALLAVHRLARTGGLGWLAVAAVGLALVVLGHNITALFFVGLASVYGVMVATSPLPPSPSAPLSRVRERGSPKSLSLWEGGRGRGLLGRVGLVVGAVVLALALAAMYWLPALVELPYSRVSEQRTGDFNVTRNLVDGTEVLQPSLLFDYYVETVPRYGLVAGLLTAGAVGVVAVAAVSRRRRLGSPVPDLVVVGAFALCFAMVVLMQLRASAVVWETVPLISFVQFPQRLFVFGSFAGAVVLGAVPWAARALGLSSRGAMVVGVAVVMALGVSSLPGSFWTWPVAASHVITEDQVGIGTAAERRLAERRAFDDYFPIWVEEDAAQITRPASPSRAESYEAANDGPVPRVRLIERGYTWMRLETDADDPTTLVLHAFHFPGWVANADGVWLDVDPAGPLGLVLVQVPAGRHVVDVRFAQTPIRLVAMVVSITAAMIVLVLGGWAIGPKLLALGVLAGVLVIGGPWLLHQARAPLDRPAPVAVDADVTPTARIVAVEGGQGSVAPGDTVSLTLIWQATGYSSRDLQSGVRLVPEGSDQVVAERWSRPDRERTPTGKWIVGEIVPDAISLRVPPNTRPGRYRLLAGLRDNDGPNRVPLSLVPVGTVEVR